MIREALQYIVNLGEAKLITSNSGRQFSDKQVHEIKTPRINGFETYTLTSIIDYITKDPDGLCSDDPLVIHIKSPDRVLLQTANRFAENYRDTLIEANCLLPSIQFGRYLDVESFIIQMQSKFVKTDMTDLLLRIVGNVKEEQVRTTSDDGVSQQVVAKTGIAKVENILVPNPVLLKPFRTFIEVNQPESMFVFRMQNGPEMAIFEADGGAWRNEAISNIRKFFEMCPDIEVLLDTKQVVILS